MPFLYAKLRTFHNFATSSLSDLYTENRLERCEQFQVNNLKHILLINEGGGFRRKTLPDLAQVAPSMCGIFVDVDQDGGKEIVLAQNFYSPQPETGRMNGGLSMMLKIDANGQFSPIWPFESGINLAQDTRRVVAADINGDGRTDLVFAANNGPVRVLLGASR